MEELRKSVADACDFVLHGICYSWAFAILFGLNYMLIKCIVSMID